VLDKTEFHIATDGHDDGRFLSCQNLPNYISFRKILPGVPVVRTVRLFARLELDCLKQAFEIVTRFDQAFSHETQAPTRPCQGQKPLDPPDAAGT
jgi:hypothetical protein